MQLSKLAGLSPDALEALQADAWLEAKRRNRAKEATDRVAFAQKYLKILDKYDHLVPLIYNPEQIQFFNNRTRRNLVLKARQVGMSTGIQADKFTQEINSTLRSVTLAHEDATTQKMRRMADRFWENMPDDKKPPRKYANSSVTTYSEFGSESVIATAGNRQTGRGGTASLIHGTEVAFWKDAQAIMAGLMQGGDPSIVLESTPNGAQGYFYQLCMEALDGNSLWTLHFFPWYEHAEYRIPLAPDENLAPYSEEELSVIATYHLTPEQLKWRREKRQELKHLFYQEYPEDVKSCFLRSGLGYFGDVSDVFKAAFGVAFDPAHLYVAGLDFGQSNDYTVLSVGDVNTKTQVALLRMNQQAWSDMRAKVAELCRAFNVFVVTGESNSMGSTNIEELHKLGVPIQPFTTDNDSKAMIMNHLHSAIHEGGWKLLNDEYQRAEFMAFTARQLPSGKWQLTAPDGEHDDTVIATALMYYTAMFGKSNVLFA
jgi:hypothetical protein